MSFISMRRDDLYELATNNFAVEVSETATKPQIIAALAEEGVTWEMARTFDKNAQAVAEALDVEIPAGVITAASVNPPAPVVDELVLEVEPPAEVTVTAPAGIVGGFAGEFLQVPAGVDGYIKDGVFTPAEVAPAPVVLETITSTTGRMPFANPAGEVVLIKMERENPHYEVRGYAFTQKNPFALVKERDADFVLSHNDGFKVASPREAKEFYG